MTESTVEISVRGAGHRVPVVRFDGREIIVSGKRLKIAGVRDEDYFEGEPVPDPHRMLAFLKEERLRADLFSFAQRIPDTARRHPFAVHWDNAAAITITSYDEWLAGLSQDTRRNVRLASKRGVTVEAVPFDDKLVRGIQGIYNETPVRQGRPFWHYGKDLETVRRDNATFQERSAFIAAYLGEDLIGFIKMVYIGRLASIMQILSKNAHQDKKVMNAMIAKAVEVSHKGGASHLQYCKYVYHKNHEDSLTEFKRRNRFEKILFPRYYVPLSLLGRVAISMKLYLSPVDLLPQPMVVRLLGWRSKFYQRKQASHVAGLPAASGT